MLHMGFKFLEKKTQITTGKTIGSFMKPMDSLKFLKYPESSMGSLIINFFS
jgi:hypothetical protein